MNIKKQVYIIIPSLSPTGPVKGAIALCNGLTEKFPVTLIDLKGGPGAHAPLHPKVKMVSLSQKTNWRKKKAEIKRLFHNAGGRNHVVSISFCFSGDCLNFFMRNHAIIISNVRGNLFKNYLLDYGPHGMLAAVLHFFLLRRFDNIIAMSNKMDRQLRSLGLRQIKIIGNFIDENSIEHYRHNRLLSNNSIHILFLASLTSRKRPDLLIKAVHSLEKNGINYHLDIIGEGPLKQKLIKQVKNLGISAKVQFHGHISEPYSMIQYADYLAIPSQSEGISRAVLEALYFGIPCIIRDVDGNDNIITHGVNGFLFKKDKELVNVLKTATLSVQNGTAPRGGILMPKFFRQNECVKKFEALING